MLGRYNLKLKYKLLIMSCLSDFMTFSARFNIQMMYISSWEYCRKINYSILCSDTHIPGTQIVNNVTLE